MSYFMSVFEDLNAIYDEGLESETKEELTEEVMSEPVVAETEATEVAEAAEEPLTEDSEEVVDNNDEETEEPKQLILECDKCGALVIKIESDAVFDEETDLVNVEETCQYCEETAGYKIIGVVAPFEVSEKSEDAPEEEIAAEEVENIEDFEIVED